MRTEIVLLNSQLSTELLHRRVPMKEKFLMALTVETKDCTALSDAELEEMADLIEDEPIIFDVGELSKQRDAWVLVTQVRDGNKLSAYGFCTLERVGGDPTVLIGLAAVRRSSRRDGALKAMITDQMRRAVLAFPDEDVFSRIANVRSSCFRRLQVAESSCSPAGLRSKR